jgi:4-amino-4-deoxy-L-arabinose transferase-like glycosyltransferase
VNSRPASVSKFWLRAPFADRAIAALLAALYVAWLLATARSLGFARDEGFYFSAAQSYARWFEMLFEHGGAAFKRSTIDSIWAQNHEHPALMKTLFAFSWMLFHQKWKLFADASTAFRFPGMCMAGLLVGVTYRFGSRAFDRRAGLIAALLVAFMPRVFYNGHLACFDMGIAAMWTLTIYVYWRSLASRRVWLWAIALGLVYGLTLETKHNAWILPLFIVPHALLVKRHEILQRWRRFRPYLPPNVVVMVLLGPVVFFALWPWLWNDTLPRLEEYVNFHMNHVYYNMEFLGVNYFTAPSPLGYMPLMILATVPGITIVLALLGSADRIVDAARSWRSAMRELLSAKPGGFVAAPRDVRGTDLLFALAFFAAVGPWFLSHTPIFGGTKHWLGAYPFLALFAGHGFSLVANAGRRAFAFAQEKKQRLFEVALGLSVTAGPLAITAHSHPFGLSSYVPFVGGTAGGASLGLNRQFWGFTTESANEEYLADHAPPGAAVFIHDTAWDSWSRMIDERRVRPDLRGVGSVSESTYALVHHELHMNEVDYEIWVAYGTDAPAYVVTHDGVPIVCIYKRP